MITIPRLESWKPLAPEGAPVSIDGILESIATSLWESRASLSSDLATGLPGVALFFAELSLRPGFANVKERALSLLEATMAGAEAMTDPSLFLGLSGIAWSVEQVYRTLFPEAAEDFNADTDELLLDLLSQTAWSGSFDVISGLVGIGVYALERMPRPSARALLSRVLAHLDDSAVDTGFGRAWPTAPHLVPVAHRAASPNGHFDLGVAHGTPGVLRLLSAMRAWGLGAERIDRLLEQGASSIRHWAESPEFSHGLPVWVAREGATPKGTRTAWCYGDLGSAVALLDTDAALACSLGHRAAAMPPEMSGVRDTSLCHGSAGNAHLFNRLYQRTDDPLFAAAARRYLQAALLSCSPHRPYGGVMAYLPDREARAGASLQVAPGLLEGAAGAGLALLASGGGSAPRWDRAFLASHHAPEGR